jgi:sec-independent protein translocase protein TatB
VFNLSGSEIIVILLLALVVLGPEKLPEALRRAGRTYAELKKLSSGFQSEMRSAFEEPVQEMRQTADLLRQAATFDTPKGGKPTKLLSDADARQRPGDEPGDEPLGEEAVADDDGLDADDELLVGDDHDAEDSELIEDDELLDAEPAPRPRDETPKA